MNPKFAGLPADLSGDHNRKQREHLARYFVQRRRADIRHYLKSDTAFPQRMEREETYQLGKDSDYKKLFVRLLRYARETVEDAQALSRVRQRVRWWAALGLLRSLASSPAAAAATLRSKVRALAAETPEDVDEISRPLVLDEDLDETADAPDIIPGADTTTDADGEVGDSERRRLLEMARAADQLEGDGDPKLLGAVKIVKGLLRGGHRPILFCRFIATAEYVAEQLRQRLPKSVTTISVTGMIPPEDREERIKQLHDKKEYVLVCTDCLSEGVNLQRYFDAVVHYDLSWNPTRHEQREGRVDRFGQTATEVFVVTYYGTDNQIDGLVLEVLIRKHQKIRSDLGISIPVPASSNAVLEALYEGLLLRRKDPEQLLLFDDKELRPKHEEFQAEWQNAADREKKSRSLFAQHTINPDEVAQEVASMRAAIGSATDVEDFMVTAARSCRGTVAVHNRGFRFDFSESPAAVREAVGGLEKFTGRFDPNSREDEIYLPRTHPIVEGLATFVMDVALDSGGDGARVIAARCGVIRTKAVTARTTLLLLRFRYHIITKAEAETRPLLAEDCQLVGFRGTPASAEWLSHEDAERLLGATPDENTSDDVARNFLKKTMGEFDAVRPRLDEVAKAQGKELLDAHQRVRTASRLRGVRYSIEPQLPPDVLGLYIYMPVIQ